MAYKQRFDGRADDELRPMEAKVGVVKNADGSASFKVGNTWAIAAVYGPREVYPRFLSNPKKGILKCHYTMMPFSGSGDRVRPGTNRRSQEIAMVMKKSLEPVLDLSAFPNSQVEVFVELPETDAGTRCAAITAAAMALADAGIPMKDMVAGVAAGFCDDKVVLDLTYMEEHINEFNEDSNGARVSDIPLAMTCRKKEITLLQMDGEIKKDELMKALEMARKGIDQIHEIQKKALLARFTEEAQ